MRVFAEILRPANCFMAIVGVLIGAAAAGVAFLPIPAPLAFASIAVFLITGGGMVINDYYDYDIDLKSKPHRPLPSGRMERSTAKKYALALFGLGIIFSYLTNATYVFYLAVLNVMIAYVYASHLKKTWAGNFVVSYLTASTVIYGALLSGSLIFLAMIFFGLMFLASMGRELSKSIEDYKVDKAMGAKTLAVTLGLDVAAWAVTAFTLIALALSPLPHIYNLVSPLYLPVVAIADVIFIYGVWLIFKHPKRAQETFKAAMAAALVAFVAGLL